MSAYTPSSALLAARRRRDARDRSGTRHRMGICGDMSALCRECQEDAEKELLAWARQQPLPQVGESLVGYWTRIGGRFRDAWYGVAFGLRREQAVQP